MIILRQSIHFFVPLVEIKVTGILPISYETKIILGPNKSTDFISRENIINPLGINPTKNIDVSKYHILYNIHKIEK